MLCYDIYLSRIVLHIPNWKQFSASLIFALYFKVNLLKLLFTVQNWCMKNTGLKKKIMGLNELVENIEKLFKYIIVFNSRKFNKIVFSFLLIFQLYQSTDLQEERGRILRSLGATTDPALIQKTLDFSIGVRNLF